MHRHESFESLPPSAIGTRSVSKGASSARDSGEYIASPREGGAVTLSTRELCRCLLAFELPHRSSSIPEARDAETVFSTRVVLPARD